MISPRPSGADLFECALPESIAEHSERAREIGGVHVFKVAGERGGEWTVDLDAPTPHVVRGSHPDPRVVLELDELDLVSMALNPSIALVLFLQGRLKVTGDLTTAWRLRKLFTLGEGAAEPTKDQAPGGDP
ncbi:SCP2 sterol-binding domain-containing protein [Streptomyces lavendulae]|uniref:SCP2 sterol-binding domain-containing protein n=1 Tax=Streptomyces lavendulae TaxID=1914 RepID=UPI0033EE760C